MSIITLTTDFGTKDHFVGAIKGTIYSELPSARIVDISHHISPFNITETAYILKNAYKSFPEGSIHIVGVDYDENRDGIYLLSRMESRMLENLHVRFGERDYGNLLLKGSKAPCPYSTCVRISQ